MNRTTLNFCELWKWFNSKVKAGRYEKLGYGSWQVFNKYKDFNTCELVLDRKFETYYTMVVIIKYNTGGTAYKQTLCSNDKSFGQFLWNNFGKHLDLNESAMTAGDGQKITGYSGVSNFAETVKVTGYANVPASNLAATTAETAKVINSVKPMATSSCVKFVDQLSNLADCSTYKYGDIVVDNSTGNTYQYQGGDNLQPITNGNNYTWSDSTTPLPGNTLNTTTRTNWDCDKYKIDSYGNISNASSIEIKLDTEKLDEIAKDIANTIQKQIDEMDADEHPMNRKENDNMKFVNFDFGPCAGDNVRMSMYGIAVKNGSGTWVSYDKTNDKIMDVDVLNFDGTQFLYKMPVAIKDITKGMVIVHNRRPMYVTDVNGADVEVVDPCAGERKTILPTASPFGFNFYTRVVSLLDGFGSTVAASDEHPFGNMLPFLMLSDNKDIDPMMLMLMMNQNGEGVQMFNNPFMFYLMASKDDSKMKDYLPFLMMSGIK